MSDTVQTIADRLQHLITIVNKCLTNVDAVLHIVERMDIDEDYSDGEDTEEDTEELLRKLPKGK